MPKYSVNDSVIYEGKTYRFPGKVVAVTTDGQYVVEAYNFDGFFGGMKHIYGEDQLKPFDWTE